MLQTYFNHGIYTKIFIRIFMSKGFTITLIYVQFIDVFVCLDACSVSTAYNYQIISFPPYRQRQELCHSNLLLLCNSGCITPVMQDRVELQLQGTKDIRPH